MVHPGWTRERRDGGRRKHYASGEMTFTNGFNNTEDAFTVVYLKIYLPPHHNYANTHTHPQPEKNVARKWTKMLTEVITEWWD